AADPPATRTEIWVRKQQERGYLTLDEMAEVGRLNPEQLANLAVTVPGATVGARPWFRFWAALPETQRQQLRAKEGLPAAQLPAAARALLLADPSNNTDVRRPGFAAYLEAGKILVGEEPGERPAAWFYLAPPADPAQLPRDAAGRMLSRGFRSRYE